MNTFDEGYAKYLKLLAQLDRTDDIGQKNLLFRELTQLLCELEHHLKSRDGRSYGEGYDREQLAYWI